MLKRYEMTFVFIDGSYEPVMEHDQTGRFVKYYDLKPLADKIQHSIMCLEDDSIDTEYRLKIAQNELKDFLSLMRGSDDKRIDPTRLK